MEDKHKPNADRTKTQAAEHSTGDEHDNPSWGFVEAMLSGTIPRRLRDSKMKATFWIAAPVLAIALFGTAAFATANTATTTTVLIYSLAFLVYGSYLGFGGLLISRVSREKD
ncbi:hypothetical protein [Tsukamurella spumae]|uniref:Uncharacterized protein n=1 Tax=Tsukamurella spumae TaxID=44753 RepID=A0A846WYB8_9ACTN|nr:hypothetical protein [Tsukamurella spumae]NKY17953.1 hypothetical protein [Tsukamurella spumae]